MGKGRNGIFLAERGFHVKGVDRSAEAILAALKRAKEKGVVIETAVVDLEGDFLIEKGAYDIILCFNYLQRSLIPQIKEGLRSGGMVVYETYTVDQPRFGRPKNPDHLLNPGELLDWFKEWKVIHYFEGIKDHPKRAIAQIVCVKPGREGL